MIACRLVVCEKSSRWAASLRDELIGGQTRIFETRSLADCEQALVQSPASVVAIEVSDVNVEAVLRFMMQVQDRYPRAVLVALLATPASEVTSLLREAGAVEVISSVLEVPRVARLARRQSSQTSNQELDLGQLIVELMPWAPQPTTPS